MICTCAVTAVMMMMMMSCDGRVPCSWCLMRLAMVQLVLFNLKTFYPMAGHDLLGNEPLGLQCTHAWCVCVCRV